MKHEILLHQHDPAQLERMYRGNKAVFKREFNSIYPQLENSPLAAFWNERLNYGSEEVSWGTRKDLGLVLGASLLAGLIAKFPGIFLLNEDFFYTRNIGFIIFPLLTAWFAWKNRLSAGKSLPVAAVMLVCLVFINLLPDVKSSDTLVLSCLHVVICLWSLLGFAFVGGDLNDPSKKLGFLKYNGDLVVMTALIGIAFGIMTLITIGLFKLIGFDIGEFYFRYIGVFGAAAAPIVGTYLTQINPQLVGKVSPVIARIFSPLVLVMLIVYLVAMGYSSKSPYNDREFLLIFNLLLIGVLAIIFFSIAESARTLKSKGEIWILFLLSAVTILVSGIAISAIILRIASGGFTPNRAAVLGSNLLIFINLVLVTGQLFLAGSKKSDLDGVRSVIGGYLPVYFAWAAIVTFLFPVIFGFK